MTTASSAVLTMPLSAPGMDAPSTPSRKDTSLARRLARVGWLITHNGMAMVGIGVVSAAALLATQPGWRAAAATHAMALLEPLATPTDSPSSSDAQMETPPTIQLAQALAATSEQLQDDAPAAALTARQAAVTHWLASKYHVAPEPVGLLVHEAYAVGKQEAIDPALLLAVMAIESSFNPFAQSHVGAQGLMQVMTHIHSDKYGSYGGEQAAFNPLTNLRVGAKVLKETISRSGGTLRGGLKYYVGAARLPDDQGYGEKVLREYARIRAVARGRTVAHDARLPIPEEGRSLRPAQTQVAHAGTAPVHVAPAVVASARHTLPHAAARTPGSSHPVEVAVLRSRAAPAGQQLAAATPSHGVETGAADASTMTE